MYYQNEVKQLRDAFETYQVVKANTDKIQQWYKNRNMWLLNLSSDSELARLFMKWLLANLKSDSVKSINIDMVWENNVYQAVTYYDPTGSYIAFKLDGYRVSIGSKNAELPSDGDEEVSKNVMRPPPITVRTESIEGRDAVIKLLNRLARVDGHRAGMYYTNTYGDWSRRDMPARPLDSVVLRGDTASVVLNDLKRFLDSEKQYEAIGQPWHRGYIFYGPPGTGKTSFCLALANELSMNLYALSLSSVKSDMKLQQLVASIPANSILVLEDIDVFHVTRDRDSDGEGLTMSGLLNALDGIATPNGLITIMTTNRIENLDEALLRPGRADLTVELNFPDTDQALAAIKRFSPDVFKVKGFPRSEVLKSGVSTAKITGIIKDNLHNDTETLANELNKIFKKEES